MNSLKGMSRRNLWHEIAVRLQSTATSSAGTTSSSVSEIQIPARIERGPTDILKALESTIKRDPTAAHYKYHDDPYLMPVSKSQIRTYALAKESGRKTAMWLHNEHADLFPEHLSVPEIEAFKPPKPYVNKEDVSEEILMKEISRGNVTDARNVYKLLEGQVSNEAKQAYLELLCFYNCKSSNHEELQEMRWFYRSSGRAKNTWMRDPEVSNIFKELTADPATVAAAYNTMICSMAKYINVDNAWYMFDKCKKENMPLTRETYNYVLTLVPSMREGDENRKELLVELCTIMAKDGIAPNLDTLNTCLNVISKMKSVKIAQELLRSVLLQFKKFKIKPSLATYYYTLTCISREGTTSFHKFMDIINGLKEKEFVITSAADTKFFSFAMKLATELYCDRNAAEAIHELLLTGNNYQFISNNYTESDYFRSYLELILKVEKFQDFYQIYDKLVPTVYIPEPNMMYNILETLEAYPPNIIVQHLPQLWSQMMMFHLLDRIPLVMMILRLMRSRCNLPDDSPLHELFAEAAFSIWEYIQFTSQKQRQAPMLTAEMLGDMLILSLRGDKLQFCADILSYLMSDMKMVQGILTHEQVNVIFEICIVQGYVGEALTLLKYLMDSNFEDVSTQARKIYKLFPLNESEKNMLIKLVGIEVLELDLQVK